MGLAFQELKTDGVFLIILEKFQVFFKCFLFVVCSTFFSSFLYILVLNMEPRSLYSLGKCVTTEHISVHCPLILPYP